MGRMGLLYWRVRRRQRCIQAKVRSTTQRRGWVIKPPLKLIPPTIWIVNRRILLTACTTLPGEPGSAHRGPSPGAAVAGSAEQPGHRRPILDAGRGDKHGHQQAQGVHDDVAFDAVDLLDAVEA